MPRRALLVVLAAGLCWACPLLGSEEEPVAEGPTESVDRIPVVDDTGPFDPSEAVDDDDGAVVLDDTDDPTDAGAFSDEDPRRARAVEASAAKGEKSENEREKGSEPGADGEPVADEAEAAAREQHKKEEVERADESGADDDKEKVELGHNPPPEPTVESEREGGKLLDAVLELGLVAALSALLAGAFVFARSHPRSVAIGVVVVAALTAFVLLQRA